ncbi:MAG: universal stress protein [Chitinophagaceae bacterium]
MKTFIVPTDFSKTARNAAIYAVQIAATVQDAKIILYNVFDKGSVEMDGSSDEEKMAAAIEMVEMSMQSIKSDMLNINDSVEISCIAEQSNSLIDSLEKFALTQHADLIIMGITETNRMEQVLVGSNTLDMVNRNVCPVIIVPQHSQFKGIKNVLLASDFKNVDETVPAKSIQAILDIFKSDVHVVNVDSEHFVELTEEYKEEKAKMELILEGYNTQYSFIRQYDFIEAISQFAADKNIDLILTIPKKHSLLSKLFVTSTTKKLAYQSELPIMAIHA